MIFTEMFKSLRHRQRHLLQRLWSLEVERELNRSNHTHGRDYHIGSTGHIPIVLLLAFTHEASSDRAQLRSRQL